jgi:hypothetical protein
MGLFDAIFGGGGSESQASTVWGKQAPFLQGLYQRAYNASLGQGSGGSPIGQAMGQIVQGGQRGGFGGNPNSRLGQLRQGGRTGPGQQYGPGAGTPAAGTTYGDPLQQLGLGLTQAGSGMLGQLGMLGQSGNPFAQAQIGQLGQGLGRLFSQQIAPTINSQFTGGGTLGGSRQALALGQAGEGLGQAFTGGALDILGNSSQLALQANQAGLNGLGQVFGAGNAATFGSLPGLAGLLGGPTVLGGGGSTSQTGGILGALTGGITKSGNWGIGF